MIPPLSDRVGFAALGSISAIDCVLLRPPVKLIRLSISRFDFAPDAASVGDCAIVSRSLLASCWKYPVVGLLSPLLLAEAYSPR